MRRTLQIDTQHTRRKLITQLEELFEIASNYACGKTEHITDETGKQRPLTIAERQFYARIAAYTAQIINCIAKGIDERQIDSDLDKLEDMLHKAAATRTAQTESSEPPEKTQ